ncbi:MAG: hypothetical protein R6U27_13610, partial [Desulfobacterales bacterium]
TDRFCYPLFVIPARAHRRQLQKSGAVAVDANSFAYLGLDIFNLGSPEGRVNDKAPVNRWGYKSWRLAIKVVGKMLSEPKECENLFFASFRRIADTVLYVPDGTL